VSPSGKVSIGSGASISPDADADNLVVQENGAAGITIGSSASSVGSIRFADSGSPRAGMIYYNHVGNEMRFYTNANERLRIDASGALVLNNSGGDAQMYFGGTSGTNRMYLARSGAETLLWNASNGAMRFGTNNAERMRLSNNGDFSVGGVINGGLTDNGFFVGANGINVYSVNSSTSSSTYHVYDNGGGAYKFFVNYSGTIKAVNTTVSGISDIRWKENIRDLDDGLAKVMQLKPRKFDWKQGKGKDVTNDRGFIAQEFETVFPDLIDDWIDPAPEGEEPYKAVRADLIPTLVKAIQEQQATIETLIQRIEALENT
jgi:hypothetical protein